MYLVSLHLPLDSLVVCQRLFQLVPCKELRVVALVNVTARGGEGEAPAEISGTLHEVLVVKLAFFPQLQKNYTMSCMWEDCYDTIRSRAIHSDVRRLTSADVE